MIIMFRYFFRIESDEIIRLLLGWEEHFNAFDIVTIDFVFSWFHDKKL